MRLVACCPPLLCKVSRLACARRAQPFVASGLTVLSGLCILRAPRVVCCAALLCTHSNKRLENAGDSALSGFARDANKSFRKHVEVRVSRFSVVQLHLFLFCCFLLPVCALHVCFFVVGRRRIVAVVGSHGTRALEYEACPLWFAYFASSVFGVYPGLFERVQQCTVGAAAVQGA